jgi:RNA polymerase sigma-70 factor (ECF subfamily)
MNRGNPEQLRSGMLMPRPAAALTRLALPRLALIMRRAPTPQARESRMSPAMHAEAELRLGAAFRAGLAGDAAAYRCFLDELSTFLRSFLRHRLHGCIDDVEDVLQETLLAIHNGRHTWDPGQALKPWVYAITRYKLIDFVRARSRHTALNVPLDAMDELLGSTDEEPAQARRGIGRLLEQLPDRHRLPILHVKIQGLSVSEAARLTGMSESAIKIGVHRGLKALATSIREAP